MHEEKPACVGYWSVGNAVGQVFGGLMGYSIGHISDGNLGNWIWYFIILGSITIAYGIILFLYLPDNPMTALWLTDREEIAVLRVLQNRIGFVNHQWKWHQFREALLDPQTTLIFLIALLNTIPAGCIGSYGSIVIRGFGFSAINTTLLHMPQGVI